MEDETNNDLNFVIIFSIMILCILNMITRTITELMISILDREEQFRLPHSLVVRFC